MKSWRRSHFECVSSTRRIDSRIAIVNYSPTGLAHSRWYIELYICCFTIPFLQEHRVLLTGTPLQNNVDELFSLLNFLEPKQFANSQAFLAEFGQCQTDEQVTKLQDILKPMMLRRLKEDVEKALKPKEETIIEVELSNIQKKYYRAILERNFSHLCKKGASAPSLMNTMMELRKCCNHPFLINGILIIIFQMWGKWLFRCRTTNCQRLSTTTATKGFRRIDTSRINTIVWQTCTHR